jgi:hypothetical protein
MPKMKKTAIVVSVAGLLLVGIVAVVTAQGGALAGLVQPFVVDVEQTVPTEVMVTVEIDENEYVTVTTPITVNVALRVSIDGPQVVTVEPLPVEEARITVSAMAAQGDPLMDNNGIEYQIEIPDGIEVIQMSSAYDSSDDFSMIGEIRNVSDHDILYTTFHYSFYDANGDLIDVDQGYTSLSEVEPGGTTPFELTTYMPFDDVASYFIQIETTFD